MAAFVFFGNRLLLEEVDGVLRIPTEARVHTALPPQSLESGRVRPGEATFEMPDSTLIPPGFRLEGLRAAHRHLSEDDFRAAGTARQRVEWVRTHAFCSRCGQPNVLCDRRESMTCVSCGQSHFARVAPAVIVLIERGSEILLGRSPRFTPGVYSTLAGFVEPGESLEECVHREIAEEVGVTVRNLRYFGSQPHPFPNSLMLGFIAEWAGGDIVLDEDEIEDAQWFSREGLPDLPHEMSIAWALIQDWLHRTNPRSTG